MSTLTAVLPHCPVRFRGLAEAPTLATQITAARELLGFSIPQAAHASGVAANTVRALERGIGNVSAFMKIAETLVPNLEVVPEKPRPTGIWRTVAGKTNRHRDPADYYATPAPIARMLLENVEFERAGTVLEPCVGQARVLEITLRNAGFEQITASDIQCIGPERRDFFDITEEHDYIITNPPFRDHGRWILHAKRLARTKIALLLPLNYLTGAARLSAIWSDTDFPLAEVLIFNRGVDFLGDPFAVSLGSSQMYCAWYVWDRAHVGDPRMRWLDNDALIARQAA